MVDEVELDDMAVQNRQALALWLDVTSQAVRADGPDLTARQTAMLLTIYLETGPHTVRGLAKRLALGKPAIVRAVDALSDAGLLMRRPDPKDRRNVFIEGTARGATQLADFARNIARNIAQITGNQITGNRSVVPNDSALDVQRQRA
jgi:DNA-binding MarR family transcriptional regulator